MRCEVCKLGPQDGVTLIRQNEKGVEGIWRCEAHTYKSLPIDVQDLVETVESGSKEIEECIRYCMHGGYPMGECPDCYPYTYDR